MSEPTTVNDTLTNYTLDMHVQTKEFDEECAIYFGKIARGSPLLDENDSDCSSSDNLWEKEVHSSSGSFVEASPHDVSEFEAREYYFGIRGRDRRGPKLIFRTSKDVFKAPMKTESVTGPRVMQLCPVYEHEKLGKDDLWTTIRSETVKLLDKWNIKHSSIDLVRFSWDDDNYEDDDEDEDDEEDRDDEEDEEDKDEEDDKEEDVETVEDIKTLPPWPVVITPVTIWIGVLPNTLPSSLAFQSSNDILSLLKQHGILDVDVAYRESVARSFSGPELYAPVSNSNTLKDVIGPLTTALGLPIASSKSPKRRGTMGFYFRVGEDLYAVTTRHVPFSDDEGNDEYIYKDGPKNEVVLMGTDTFSIFLRTIQGQIGSLDIHVDSLNHHASEFKATSKAGGPKAVGASVEHARVQNELVQTRSEIKELKEFFVKVKKEWSKLEDRVIGHVVWAPPISATHGYTKDVCVVKLDKTKFSRNFKGNVLDMGAEMVPSKFIPLMYTRGNAGFGFVYPLQDQLLKLQGILSAEEIRKTASKDHRGDPMRYVIKNGIASFTTVGCLNGFESHVRRYSVLGKIDSVEAAVCRPDMDSDPFSKSGDSGSIIVDEQGKFVALLTSGTGPTDSPDITYGSPMHWLWEVIKAQFPDADLNFGVKNN